MEGAGGGVQERVNKLPYGLRVETSRGPSLRIATSAYTTRYDTIQKIPQVL